MAQKFVAHLVTTSAKKQKKKKMQMQPAYFRLQLITFCDSRLQLTTADELQLCGML